MVNFQSNNCITIAHYLLSALAAGIGGILYPARFTAGAAQAGESLLLDSIAVRLRMCRRSYIPMKS
jgi:predicted ABC-type sugar transport system permease subunit